MHKLALATAVVVLGLALAPVACSTSGDDDETNGAPAGHDASSGSGGEAGTEGGSASNREPASDAAAADSGGPASDGGPGDAGALPGDAEAARDGGDASDADAATARPWPASIGCQATTNGVVLADCDSDGIADMSDNCPGVPNVDQADADKNGVGDACEESFANCKRLGDLTPAGDFSGLDLRACNLVIETPPDGGTSASSFDDADLSCSSVYLFTKEASFSGTKLTNVCLSLPPTSTTTLSNATPAGGVFNTGAFVLSGGDFSNARFSQNSAVTATGTTLVGTHFTQLKQLTINGGTLAGATLIQDLGVSLTGCDASGASLIESTVQLKSVDVEGMKCTLSTVNCSGGDTGTVDPSCGALSTAPSCQ